MHAASEVRRVAGKGWRVGGQCGRGGVAYDTWGGGLGMRASLLPRGEGGWRPLLPRFCPK